MPTFFASTAKGIEGLLFEELKTLGATSVRETRAGVYFEGDIQTAYRVCLWSRIANSVYLPLLNFIAKDGDELYREVMKLDWLEHMASDGSFRIDVDGKHTTINHPHFIGQRIKDAIVDQIRDKLGKRPNIQSERPDIVLHAYVKGDEFTLNLDLSGESLHRRGYRQEVGRAPLKETLAAAVLIRAGWPEELKKPEPVLFDPMCGTGTLLIEAALMAYDMAPGLQRPYYGFLGWRQHRKSIWQELLNEAKARAEAGIQASKALIYGSDIDRVTVAKAESNIRRAGLFNYIRVEQDDATKLDAAVVDTGLIVLNPPYGERMDLTEDELSQLFREFGENLKLHYGFWQVAIFTGNPDSVKSIGMRPHKIYKLFNGLLDCELLKFEVKTESFKREESFQNRFVRQAKLLQEQGLSEHAMGIVNRLTKNEKHMRSWRKRDAIQCYRLYDADIPEYAAAIDIYENFVHIQEYQAGKDIDPKVAHQHLVEIVAATQQFTKANWDHIFVKQRLRQKGESQYEKLDQKEEFHIIHEGAAKFWVNFSDYLDTGLFLDHRLMRQKVAEASIGKTLLNLFAYTCSASVHAALLGARMVTSVDMSRTYIDWGKRNFLLNDIPLNKHEFTQADCMQWLETETDKFDVIFIDPPSFSNSKRMDGTFDVQRDHVKLIQMAVKLLKPKGKIFFSNNLRSFKMDYEALQPLNIQDISKTSLSPDFVRRPNIHHGFEITL
ncbi:MAG: bifunctional 23S rRNA (guanine(2069)-N(7))-methyltransferase RlmK/23S rRNA (guanine(2445)-N(2))-methyltransferase RlmL [Gammaproteobacteria bacterium]|nr:bifunctional 23S rRNA (guanine(2069)-N(7))-methyltransferase RlmK/23S rRNA (guanine(2445)-N(2))-methyltransferase RlmL [Gammaproteobacteria bacterium]